MISRPLPLPAQYTLAALVLLLSVIFQGWFGYKLTVRGIRPDLPVVVLAAVSGLMGGARRGGAFGLLVGLLSAALVPINPGTRIASCALGGAATGAVRSVVAWDTIFLAPICGLVCSAAVGVSALFMAPTHHLHAWAAGFICETIYNMMLALPLFFALRALRLGQSGEPSLFGG